MQENTNTQGNSLEGSFICFFLLIIFMASTIFQACTLIIFVW